MARLLKVKLKMASVNDVGSMSLNSVQENTSNKFIIGILNSNLIFDYYRVFLNCSVNIQINDLKQIPIIVADSNNVAKLESLVDKAIELKKTELTCPISALGSENELTKIEQKIDNIVNSLYGI